MSIDLDKRIIKGKKPLSAFDELESKYIGTDCFFSDKPSDFADLSKCQVGKLMSLDAVSGMFGASKNNSYAVFCFCLPCEWVEEKKEPKYRPYTIKDFEEAFLKGEFEDFIIFRDKNYPDNVYTLRYNGNFISGGIEFICLGARSISFRNLFEDYEVMNTDGDFVPFGVLEE